MNHLFNILVSFQNYYAWLSVLNIYVWILKFMITRESMNNKVGILTNTWWAYVQKFRLVFPISENLIWSKYGKNDDFTWSDLLWTKRDTITLYEEGKRLFRFNQDKWHQKRNPNWIIKYPTQINYLLNSQTTMLRVHKRNSNLIKN